MSHFSLLIGRLLFYQWWELLYESAGISKSLYKSSVEIGWIPNSKDWWFVSTTHRRKIVLQISDILFDPNLEIRVILSHNYGLGLCFHTKCLMAQRNQFLQFESRILTGTEIKCLQLEKEPLAFVYTWSTFMHILWAVNSCCRQIMSHYGLSSVNFQHTHPSRFTGGRGGPCIRWVFNCLQNSRSTCQCRCRPWVGYCCPTHLTRHPSKRNWCW